MNTEVFHSKYRYSARDKLARRLWHRKNRATVAGKERDARRRAINQKKSQGRKNSGKRWKEWEVRLLWDRCLTDNEIATFLQRSFMAVSKARGNNLTLAPKDWEPKGPKRVD